LGAQTTQSWLVAYLMNIYISTRTLANRSPPVSDAGAARSQPHKGLPAPLLSFSTSPDQSSSSAADRVDFQGRSIDLACDLCPRRGQYRKETLIARFGGDVLMIARFGGKVLMPDVPHLIARCPQKDVLWQGVLRGPAWERKRITRPSRFDTAPRHPLIAAHATIPRELLRQRGRSFGADDSSAHRVPVLGCLRGSPPELTGQGMIALARRAGVYYADLRERRK
jgi:hypothetical protein